MNIAEYIKERAMLGSDEKVIVKELWDGRYRANVWKFNPNRIVQSYFIHVSGEQIVSCSPDIGA